MFKTLFYALSVAFLPFVFLTSSFMLGYAIKRKNTDK